MESIKAEIVSNIKYGENLYKLELFSPAVCKNAIPGQFVNVKCACEGTYDPLLRRPFSIYEVDRKFNVFSILFILKGKGTKFLSNQKKGGTLDLIGPLGNGIEINEKNLNYVLVGGGIGVAPLCFIAKELLEAENNVLFVAGFKDESFFGWQKDLVRILRNYRLFTENGSFGQKGMPIEFIKDNIKNLKKHKFIFCGPNEMLKNFKNLFRNKNMEAFVLMEEIIACGIGACMGCVIKLEKKDGKIEYKKVCSDGPVFNLMEVVFD